MRNDSLSLELTRKVIPTGTPGLCMAQSHSWSFHDRARMIMKEGAWLASIAVVLIYYVIQIKQFLLFIGEQQEVWNTSNYRLKSGHFPFRSSYLVIDEFVILN